MVSNMHRKRTVGWIAGAALAATAVGLAGYSSGTGPMAKNGPAAHSSNVTDPKKGKEEAVEVTIAYGGIGNTWHEN
jgi:hypothetical protein